LADFSKFYPSFFLGDERELLNAISFRQIHTLQDLPGIVVFRGHVYRIELRNKSWKPECVGSFTSRYITLPLIATLTHLAIVPIEGAVLFELHKLCATFSASVDINYRLPIKAYYRSYTLRHISANQQITSHILTPVVWSEKLITSDQRHLALIS
jgi:hypothetical protein